MGMGRKRQGTVDTREASGLPFEEYPICGHYRRGGTSLGCRSLAICEVLFHEFGYFGAEYIFAPASVVADMGVFPESLSAADHQTPIVFESV